MPEPGQNLSQYELIEKIGEGGMGEVWRALDTSLDREVALKLFPEAFAERADRLARFEREAKLLASLNHPNIAIIHGLHVFGEPVLEPCAIRANAIAAGGVIHEVVPFVRIVGQRIEFVRTARVPVHVLPRMVADHAHRPVLVADQRPRLSSSST